MALDTVARWRRGAGVQPSALVRFAQALGYDGFSGLQRVFRGRLVERSNHSPGLRNYRERIEAFRAGQRALRARAACSTSSSPTASPRSSSCTSTSPPPTSPPR